VSVRRQNILDKVGSDLREGLAVASEKFVRDGDRAIVPNRATTGSDGHVERLIGSIRRECLDHLIIFNGAHLRHVLGAYKRYYNDVRTHLALGKDTPLGRAVQRAGMITPIPHLGGLHHTFARI
jgi:transposase InsO family protein